MGSKTLSKIEAVKFLLDPCVLQHLKSCYAQDIWYLRILNVILKGAGYNKTCCCRTIVILSELLLINLTQSRKKLHYIQIFLRPC